MNDTYVPFALVFLLLNTIINHWIQTDRIRELDKRIARIELIEYFKNNIEIKEEKEENALQKKDKNI